MSNEIPPPASCPSSSSFFFFFFFFLLNKQLIELCGRRRFLVFQLFVSSDTPWLHFHYIFFIDFSAQSYSLSLYIQKFFVAHQRVLGLCTKWFEKRGSNQKKFPCFDLFISQVLVFQKKKKGTEACMLTSLFSQFPPNPEFHIIKKQFF